MSEPIDHYAKAVELAQIAEAKAVDSRHYAAVAHLHLDLHTARDSDSDYWEQAGQLEALIEAVRALLRNQVGSTLDTATFTAPWAVVDKLRELTS